MLLVARIEDQIVIMAKVLMFLVPFNHLIEVTITICLHMYIKKKVIK